MKTPVSFVLCAVAFGMLSLASSASGGALSYDTKSSTTAVTTSSQSDLLEDYFRPELMLRYTHDFDMDFDDARGGNVSSDEAEIQVPLPPFKGGNFVFGAQLYYRYMNLDIDTPGYRNTFDLHTIRVPLQAAWLSPDSPWFVFAYAEPGISSDFNSVNHDAFDLSASVDVGYRFSPNFVLAVGAYYTRDYGRDLVLPSLGLLWRINDWWSVQVTPLEASTTFRMGEDWRLKVKAIVYGGRWTVENEGQRQRVELDGGKAGVDLERRLFRKAWLSVGAGANLFNNLRIEDSPNHQLFDRDLKAGFYLTGALRWEF
jgi:hypothetical protein